MPSKHAGKPLTRSETLIVLSQLEMYALARETTFGKKEKKIFSPLTVVCFESKELAPQI